MLDKQACSLCESSKILWSTLLCSLLQSLPLAGICVSMFTLFTRVFSCLWRVTIYAAIMLYWSVTGISWVLLAAWHTIGQMPKTCPSLTAADLQLNACLSSQIAQQIFLHNAGQLLPQQSVPEGAPKSQRQEWRGKWHPTGGNDWLHLVSTHAMPMLYNQANRTKSWLVVSAHITVA